MLLAGQIGGSDQWGNIVSGIDLIRRIEGDANVHGLTVPLLVTSSGDKMGKSAGNAVWIDRSMTSSLDLYQYIAGLSDADVAKILPIFSFEDVAAVKERLARHQEDPDRSQLQRHLAYEMVSLVHSAEEAEASQRASDILFSASGDHRLSELKGALEICASATEASAGQLLGKRYVDVVHLLYPELSKGAIRALMRAGAVWFDGARVDSPQRYIESDDAVRRNLTIVRLGKKQFKLLKTTL